MANYYVNKRYNREFSNEELNNMAQALYNTMFLFTRIFNFTSGLFKRVKLNVAVMYTYENEIKYQLAIKKFIGTTSTNTCGVQYIDKMFISLTRCYSFYDTMIHENAHYLNTYLLNIPSTQ